MNAKPETYDFVGVLCHAEEGEFREEVQQMLNSLVKELRRYGGKGHVSVKLALATASKEGGDPQIIVVPSVTRSAPKRERGRTFFYANGEGALTRHPPKEEAGFLLRSVPTEKD